MKNKKWMLKKIKDTGEFREYVVSKGKKESDIFCKTRDSECEILDKIGVSIKRLNDSEK